MLLNDITPLILTFNEASNIRETISRLSWASKIVVVDSFSSDETLETISEFPNTVLVQRKFDNHTNQWNFGLRQIDTTWTLTMDADYRCTESLANELETLIPKFPAYSIRIRYAIVGKPLRGSLYPPRVSLFESSKFRYVQDGHTQLLDVEGIETGQLRHGFLHDDRKSLGHWVKSQYKYADLEAQKLMTASKLGWKDRIRRCYVLAPVLTLFYCLFYKMLLLDGWRGFYYTFQRVFAELLLSMVLLERKLKE